MRFHTHDHTPRLPSHTPLHIKILTAFAVSLMCLIFGMGAFACAFYAHSFSGALLLIALPAAGILWHRIHLQDISRAYVEIEGDAIRVVDYCLGFKKEKHFTFSDITSAQILHGGALPVKGYILSSYTPYIILRQGKKYLFKIISLPETRELFAQYLSDV